MTASRRCVTVAALLLHAGVAHAGQITSPAYEGPAAPLPPEVIAREAEGRTTIRAVRVDTPLRIDGTFDEALYTSVPAMTDFVQVEPDLGAPATEKTEVWIAFDGDNVYLSFRCWDSQPERRVATEMRRDGNNLYNGNDVISIFVDTFYDRRNGFGITMNSIGGRNDGQVINGQYNSDWNPVWAMANGRFDGGWTLEVALPFKSLRYRTGTDQLWGFNALRTVRWRNELSVLIPVPPLRGMNSIRQPQLAATIVGIEAPPASNNLELKPYAVSSLTTDAPDGSPASTSTDGDIGLDVKYSPTQNLVADFTYNTDFAQVEADEQQVNLTRFSLFFPEKREFFLENRDTFAFGGVGTGGRGGGSGGDTPILFYSRRIGLEAGQQVPIIAGGRLTGRVGRFTVGLMDIQTRSSDATNARSTNFSTIRLKRDILARSSVGVLATGRSVGSGGGGANAAFGLDANFNFLRYLTIDSYWAKTHSDGAAGGDDTSYRAAADYAGDRYGMQLEHLAVGSRFRPELGFVRRRDIRRSFGEARFSPRLASDTIRKLSWTGSIAYVENGAGRLEAREEVADFGIEFQNADLFNLTYTRAYEFVPRAFQIASDVSVPVGGYDTDTVTLRYALGPQRAASVGVAAEYGTFYSGHRAAVSATRGRLNFGPRLSLEPTYSVNWVDLREGSFSTHLGGSRVTYTMTPWMFVSALVQFNSASESLSANVRFRWEYQPGSELFVVYNDERDTAGRGVPELMTRALVVKFNRFFRS
ncbi:MAG: DUF5916 domain-containing protein [Acidobacteria bacterium]|nr:DUF5916 domain-containing protein [Acidobacteriota bacterium]